MSSNLPSSNQSFDKLVSQFDYDHTTPLQAAESGMQHKNGVSIYDVSYAGLKNERIIAHWVLPGVRRVTGGRPFPAVIYVHPAPGDRSSFLDEAILLGQQETASLLVEAPWAHLEAWGRALGNPENDRQIFIDVIKNLRRAVDYTASQPEVDARSIGFVGHSLGALVGGVLSGVEKRIMAFVLMSGAPSFTDVAMLNMPTLQGAELDRYDQAMDPIDPVYYVEHAAPAALFFQFGKNDEAFSHDQFETFARAGSEPKLTRWYDTGHFFQDEGAQQDRLEWLKHQLRTES